LVSRISRRVNASKSTPLIRIVVFAALVNDEPSAGLDAHVMAGVTTALGDVREADAEPHPLAFEATADDLRAAGDNVGLDVRVSRRHVGERGDGEERTRATR
jgi:hypothetical protein